MWSSMAVTSPIISPVRSPPLSLTSSQRHLNFATSSQIQTIIPLRRSHPSLRATSDGLSTPPAIIPPPKTKEYLQWDSITAKFAAAANIPFLLLQIPQIILNARNLHIGNKTALSAVPWLGMLTGLLGNLSLMSYFTKKNEPEAILIQTLGAISTYIVISQLTIAESMPLPHFLSTTVLVILGLTFNFLNHFRSINKNIWKMWEDAVTIGSLSVLPQVMWSTFVPGSSSMLPGIMSFSAATAAVVMSEQGAEFVRCMSGWSATLLFMWMPVAQMWANYLNPKNVKGLSAVTMVLLMMGNGLMIPRALFVRDLMWFVGSTWAAFLHGWLNLVCMYCFGCVGKEVPLAATVGLFSWIGLILWQDTLAHIKGSRGPSLKELVFGR